MQKMPKGLNTFARRCTVPTLLLPDYCSSSGMAHEVGSWPITGEHKEKISLEKKMNAAPFLFV